LTKNFFETLYTAQNFAPQKVYRKNYRFELYVFLFFAKYYYDCCKNFVFYISKFIWGFFMLWILYRLFFDI